jgi:hypothetical protein
MFLFNALATLAGVQADHMCAALYLMARLVAVASFWRAPKHSTFTGLDVDAAILTDGRSPIRGALSRGDGVAFGVVSDDALWWSGSHLSPISSL